MTTLALFSALNVWPTLLRQARRAINATSPTKPAIRSIYPIAPRGHWYHLALRGRTRADRAIHTFFAAPLTRISPNICLDKRQSRVSVFSFVEPQLPSLVDQPPEGAQWIHEVKHDGYRTLLAVQRGSVVAYTRNGFDWTDRYPRIFQAAAKLHCRSAILDGEVIVQDCRGVSDFEALQAALRSKRAPLIFYAFDLLHLDGKDYRNMPLVERRTKLKHLVESSPSAIQFSEEFLGDAELSS